MYFRFPTSCPYSKVLEEQVAPVVLDVEEEAEDEDHVHEADKDDDDHASVDGHLDHLAAPLLHGGPHPRRLTSQVVVRGGWRGGGGGPLKVSNYHTISIIQTCLDLLSKNPFITVKQLYLLLYHNYGFLNDV